MIRQRLLLRTVHTRLARSEIVPSLISCRRWASTLEIKLRQYQEECIDSVLSHLKSGSKRLGISLATGSGKTVVFTHLIDRVPKNPVTDGTQTLILVHRRELVEQAVRHCILANPDRTVEVEMGKSHASGLADVTVASVQSIKSGDRLKKFSPEKFKLVLVDEAHHIVASSYRAVLKHFNLWKDDEQAASPALIGVSATFSRFDGLKLGAAIDEIVYHKDYIDMIGEKWLSDIIFTTVKSHVDMSKVKNDAFGDYNLGSLSRACNTKEANEVTVRTWLAKAQGRQSTLVFCVDTAHVADLAETFRRHGVDARYVLGNDRVDDRAAKLEDFKQSRFPVMLNCGVFTEGTDIPNCDCVLLARPTRSRNLLVQMIGRGMRLHPEKTNCHVIDMVASLTTGIITTPTLFGLDPDQLLDAATVEDLKTKPAEESFSADASSEDFAHVPKRGAPISRVTFTEYDSVQDFLNDHAEDQHIRKLSRNAWVSVGDDRFILVNRFGEFITIEPANSASEKPMFRVRCNERVAYTLPNQRWRPVKRAEDIAMAESLESAVHAADTFVVSKDSFERFMTIASAPWRMAECTDEQLEFLNRTIGKNNPLRKDDLTKGQAADMITKVKFGARGRFVKVMASFKRAQNEEHRVEELRRREHVSVGPVPV